MNPVFHIRRLEEFMDFRNVPQHLRLAVACRSIVGQIGRQWVEAVSPNLRDYESFKKGFLTNWWSKSRQSSVRCAIYQAKYDRRSNLSLSAHFLKYATMASYLDPRPSDADLIEAIKSHFPITVQRAMLTSQLHTVEETLDLLKRIEIMEASESFQRPNASPQSHHQNASRQGPNPPRNDHRGQTQPQVRQVQYQQPRSRSHGNRRRNYRNYDPRRGGESSGGGSGPLNPNASPFHGGHEPTNSNDQRTGN
ncbi:hypothetical protein B7P43_G16574 [Cryptotermes secundus]|uniref:Retrotransposon gag domain-containing protein n=1 Tax=Cryptotermes secundus TaxID=105785 RepID=A0A2J7QWL9_9NEOP|nr:hypothetical protein B7P43_G16574 [Cryptotermes secundus]